MRLLFYLVLSASYAVVAAQQYTPLYVHTDTLSGYGLIGQDGRWSIPPKYGSITINDNRVAVWQDGLWALFTTEGKQLTDFYYSELDIEDYGYGMNFIETRSADRRHYGLTDTNGREILPTAYAHINAFYSYDHHKCITYCLGPDSCGLLDSNLQPLLPPVYSNIIPIYSEFMDVQRMDKTAVFDYSGRQIGSDWYDGNSSEATGFLLCEKFLPVRLDGRYGVLNLQTGGYQVKPVYEELGANFVTPGYPHFFYRENGLLGMMDTSGRQLTPPIYKEETVDYDSYLLGLKKDSLWAFFDTHGKRVTGFMYEAISMDAYGHGLAIVKQHGLWTLVDSLIRPLSAAYEEITPRWAGQQYSVVRRQGKYGVISFRGKEIIPCRYDEIILSETGMAVARDSNLYGLLDTGGKIVLPFEYEEITFDSYGGGYYRYELDQRIRVKKNGLYGMVTAEGKIILPIQYRYVSYDYELFLIYNYLPCFDCWGLMRIGEPAEPERIGICSPDGVRCTDYIYDRVRHIFPNGALIFERSGKTGYRSPDGKEKMLE